MFLTCGILKISLARKDYVLAWKVEFLVFLVIKKQFQSLHSYINFHVDKKGKLTNIQGNIWNATDIIIRLQFSWILD